MRVLVVVGPGVVADLALLREIVEPEFRVLGVAGQLAPAADPDRLRELLTGAGREGPSAVVALPGPEPAARRLTREPGPHAARTVWYDLARTGPLAVAPGSAHLSGRGVAGLVWAVRHAVHRVRHPPRRIGYGDDPDQWAELRMPDRAPGPAPVPVPVAVLVHGGFWRSIWGADLLDALAIDLARRGFAAWNLEYRRPDQHGWAATTADLAGGLAALATVAGDGAPLDLDRVAVIGHSAGGQLALRVAADTGRVALAVSLAGVLDLVEAERRWIGTGAVAAALGGTAAELPETYRGADPLARLPLGVPQLVVQGRDDDLDLIDLNRRYARAARAAGDEVTHLEQPGDHFAVIDPGSEIWHATATAITSRLVPDQR
ncbi:MAG: alpha/beta hydrolase fold domain-containing protein [Micromonosporaceae bacterium]|nr:alpha/beta hydrolase fold domain-containing protein [Micromonosporaceae bacterium]